MKRAQPVRSRSRSALGPCPAQVGSWASSHLVGLALACLLAVPLGLFGTSLLTWSGILHERTRRVHRALWFGPYALSRLAWRTGGVFFMLPSAEPAAITGNRRLASEGVYMSFASAQNASGKTINCWSDKIYSRK